MGWLRQILVVALPVLALLGASWGFMEYELHRERMQNNPAAVYQHYESELQRYAERLQTGKVDTLGGGFRMPQFLIDYGARHVVKRCDCFVIGFGCMPTDAVPELWFSPSGFDPLPPDLEALKQSKKYFNFEQLTRQWGVCHWDL